MIMTKHYYFLPDGREKKKEKEKRRICPRYAEHLKGNMRKKTKMKKGFPEPHPITPIGRFQQISPLSKTWYIKKKKKTAT